MKLLVLLSTIIFNIPTGPNQVTYARTYQVHLAEWKQSHIWTAFRGAMLNDPALFAFLWPRVREQAFFQHHVIQTLEGSPGQTLIFRNIPCCNGLRLKMCDRQSGQCTTWSEWLQRGGTY